MKPIIRFFFPFASALMILSSARAGVPLKCEPASLKKQGTKIYLNSRNGTLWLAASPATGKAFSDLGFKTVIKPSDIPAEVQPRTLSNNFSCPLRSGSVKAYDAYPYTLLAVNPCFENIAKNLGFVLHPAQQNYGSMEGNSNLQWSNIELCTDGQSIYHCVQSTSEMRDCLKLAEKTLLN